MKQNNNNSNNMIEINDDYNNNIAIPISKYGR